MVGPPLILFSYTKVIHFTETIIKLKLRKPNKKTNLFLWLGDVMGFLPTKLNHEPWYVSKLVSIYAIIWHLGMFA